MVNDRAFKDGFKIVAGQTSPEDQLAAGSYPSSGSFVDVRGYEWAHILVHLGAIDASDTPTFTPQSTDAANGTLQDIDASIIHVSAADDDDEFVLWSIETQKLAEGQTHITLTVSDVTNGSYGDIVHILGTARHAPVTQTAALPSGSQYEYAG